MKCENVTQVESIDGSCVNFEFCDMNFCYKITCAENKNEKALFVFQNTAGYRTEYTAKARA